MSAIARLSSVRAGDVATTSVTTCRIVKKKANGKELSVIHLDPVALDGFPARIGLVQGAPGPFPLEPKRAGCP